jgi:hypothetical protein
VIDDRIVVDPGANIGNIALRKGPHSISVPYSHEAGPGELKLEWSRAGDPGMREVPSSAVSTLAVAEPARPNR